MRIYIAKPPCWDEVKKRFEFNEATVVFTYGDVIYNPGNVELEQHVIEHEMVHAEQQKNDQTVAKLWWQQYLDDPEFRIGQEVEAYGTQYRWICDNEVKDRNKRARILHQLSGYLSGPMYGNAISRIEASQRIKRFSGR